MKRLDHVLDHHEEEQSKDIHVSSFVSNSRYNFTRIGDTGLFIGSSLQGTEEKKVTSLGLAEASSQFGGIINCSERSYIGITCNYLHVPVPVCFQYYFLFIEFQEGKSDKNKIGKILSASLAFVLENIHQKVLIHSAAGRLDMQ